MKKPMTQQEAFDEVFRRLDLLAQSGQSLFESRQAVVYLGQYILEALIKCKLFDRDGVVASLEAFAQDAGQFCATQLSVPERPNPDLATIAEAIRGGQPPQLFVIEGGAGNDDGPDAA